MNLRQIPTLRVISSLIFSVFLLKGVFLSLLVPIFQNPDEQIHYGTVQHWAEPQEKDWEIREIGRRDPISSDISRSPISLNTRKPHRATCPPDDDTLTI